MAYKFGRAVPAAAVVALGTILGTLDIAGVDRVEPIELFMAAQIAGAGPALLRWAVG